MEQEMIFKTLITELLKMDTIHHEYIDNDNTYVIDSQKDGNELVIRVSIKENKDKKEFENWVNSLDDDLFNEVWETLSEEDNLHSLNELYNSDNYKEVIEKFKLKTKEVAKKKIKSLQKLINGQ